MFPVRCLWPEQKCLSSTKILIIEKRPLPGGTLAMIQRLLTRRPIEMKYIMKLALLLVLVPQWIMASDSPPNILLIITDQHTGSVMTQRGYEHVTTPGIDKIADADFSPVGKFPDLAAYPMPQDLTEGH
jgi:hypothetical protein